VSVQSRSPTLNLFAQLCGIGKGIEDNIYDLMQAVRTCIDLGERGWLLALALVNVALGGDAPVPDLVNVVPPGYGKYLTKVAVVDDKVLFEVLPDVPFQKGLFISRVTDKESGTTKAVVEDTRFPMAFGILIEYNHPLHGFSRELLVIHTVPTGEYVFKSFIAPRSVADRVAEIAAQLGTWHVEKEFLKYEAVQKVEELINEFGSVENLLKAVREGKAELPQGVYVKPPEAEERRKHRVTPP